MEADALALLLGAHPVRLHDQLPFHLPGFFDRARQLSRGARGAVAQDRAASSYLDLFKYWLKIFADRLRHGRRRRASSCPTSSAPTGRSSPTRSGPVIGPLMAYEVLTAFFLEAGFLGVMLFGMDRVGQAAAFLRDADGRHRHLHQRLLDPERQQLDADADRLCRSARTASSCRAEAGRRSSSTRAFPIAWSTPCSPPI